jgi:hydroxypyruvate isomerase
MSWGVTSPVSSVIKRPCSFSPMLHHSQLETAALTCNRDADQAYHVARLRHAAQETLVGGVSFPIEASNPACSWPSLPLTHVTHTNTARTC